MQRQWLWIAMVSAGLLAACGGGGGGSSSGSGGGGTLEPAANLSISGAAAKGLMANAIVTAHAVDAAGKIAAAELGRAVTNDKGQYTLSFTATKGEPYVIKVTAQAGTRHYDEATGASQELPAGFTMRTVFVPAETGTVSTSLNVTPFSELAVAAAEKVGLTKANVEQARSNVAQLLGFDPVVVPVVDFTNSDAVQAASEDSKKLLVMLTAVSKLASDNAAALGCAQASAGEKTKCVVDAMSKAARLDSVELKTGSIDISGRLNTAMQAVVANPALNVSGLNASALSFVGSKLNCAATSTCTPAPASAMPVIAAAKSLFTSLRSDVQALFVSADPSKPSAFIQEKNRFTTALRDVQAPAEMVGKDLGALLMGVDLYNDVKAERSAVLSRGGAGGAFTADLASMYLPNYNTVACLLTQDANGATPATSKDNANTISCRATYNVDWSTDVNGLAEWAHGFTLTPVRDASNRVVPGQFTYTSRARYRPVTFDYWTGAIFPAGSSVTMPGTQIYSGTFNTTTDAAGGLVSFQAKGNLPGAFAMGGTELVSKYHTWDLAGSRTVAGGNLATNAFSGTVVATNNDAGNTQQSSLTIRKASLQEIPVSRDVNGNIVAPDSSAAVASAGGQVGEAAFDVLWATAAGVEFEGAVSATNVAWDKSKTRYMPTALAISGALRNVNGAAKTEFFSGALELSVAGLAAFDARVENSSSNFVTVNAGLQGKVAATDRPALQLNVGTSMKSFETEPTQVTVGYRSLRNGTPASAVAFTVSRTAAGVVLDLKDLTAGLSMTVPQGANSADLLLNGSTRIGVLQKNGVMTFADSSFVSLDLGL